MRTAVYCVSKNGYETCLKIRNNVYKNLHIYVSQRVANMLNLESENVGNLFVINERVPILLEKTFNLSPRSKGSGSPSSILNLFDVIKILSYFEEISSLKKLLNKILFRNYMFMGIKRGKNLNKKLSLLKSISFQKRKFFIFSFCDNSRPIILVQRYYVYKIHA